MPRPAAVALDADAQAQSGEPVTAGGPYDAESRTGAPPATATKGVRVIMLFAPIGPTLAALYVMKIALVLAVSSIKVVAPVPTTVFASDASDRPSVTRARTV